MKLKKNTHVEKITYIQKNKDVWDNIKYMSQMESRVFDLYSSS